MIDGEEEGDNASCSVAMSGDGWIVAIGAQWNDGNRYSVGRAQVYRVKDTNEN